MYYEKLCEKELLFCFQQTCFSDEYHILYTFFSLPPPHLHLLFVDATGDAPKARCFVVGCDHIVS